MIVLNYLLNFRPTLVLREYKLKQKNMKQIMFLIVPYAENSVTVTNKYSDKWLKLIRKT